MRLQAQPPLRMVQAIPNRRFGIRNTVRSVHRLEIETVELERGVTLRRAVLLREYELQLVAFRGDHVAVRFRADANPIDPLRWDNRAIGFNADFEPLLVQRTDQGRVELQQRLPARANDIGLSL